MGTVFSSRFEWNEYMRFAWRWTHANRWVIVWWITRERSKRR